MIHIVLSRTGSFPRGLSWHSLVLEAPSSDSDGEELPHPSSGEIDSLVFPKFRFFSEVSIAE